MHFYESTMAEVVPRHLVEMKNGEGLRPTRMTDVKKWWKEDRFVVPSVTTVLSVLDKPALGVWKVNQHLETAFKYAESLLGMGEVEYYREIKRLTESRMDMAPTAGTNVHEILENWLNGKVPFDAHERKIIDKVWGAIHEATGIIIPEGTPELKFVDSRYGGCADLVLKDWIIDYKTKLTADKFKPGKMAYDEHRMQLAACRKAINPNARCANVFICIETGEVDFHEHTESELKTGWSIFESALDIWWAKNGAVAA